MQWLNKASKIVQDYMKAQNDTALQKSIVEQLSKMQHVQKLKEITLG